MYGLRTSVLLALLATTCGCANFRTCRDPWWGRDKAQHLVISMAIGAGGSAFASGHMDPDAAYAVGWSVAMTAGTGKEWYDLAWKKSCWSWRDYFWDLLGASLGASLSWALD